MWSAKPESNETNKVICSLVTLTNKNLRLGKTVGMENRPRVGWREGWTTEELLREILGAGRVLCPNFGGVSMTTFVKIHKTCTPPLKEWILLHVSLQFQIVDQKNQKVGVLLGRERAFCF